MGDETKLTPAEVRALEATARGKVVRIYRAGGNILRGPKGVGATVLWKLSNKNFITDGPAVSEALDRICTQVVTKAGHAALFKGTSK